MPKSFTPIKISGHVVKKPFGIGSKSERQAVCLETLDGEYVLRRRGGNSFYDPALEELVGKTINCIGYLADYTIVMSRWTENKS